MKFNATNTNNNGIPNTIQEYTEHTGKRFRMLKDQKARGLTREQAFEEWRAEATRQLVTN